MKKSVLHHEIIISTTTGPSYFPKFEPKIDDILVHNGNLQTKKMHSILLFYSELSDIKCNGRESRKCRLSLSVQTIVRFSAGVILFSSTILSGTSKL